MDVAAWYVLYTCNKLLEKNTCHYFQRGVKNLVLAFFKDYFNLGPCSLGRKKTIFKVREKKRRTVNNCRKTKQTFGIFNRFHFPPNKVTCQELLKKTFFGPYNWLPIFNCCQSLLKGQCLTSLSPSPYIIIFDCNTNSIHFCLLKEEYNFY